MVKSLLDEKEKFEEAKKDLDDFLENVTSEYGGKPIFSPIKFLDEGGNINPSGVARIAQKVDIFWWENVTDIVRWGLLFPTIEDVDRVIQSLWEKGFSVKDHFKNPTNLWYRDAQFFYKTPNGISGEVQIHIPAILVAKDGEKVYKNWLITKNEYNKILEMAQEEWGKW